MKRPTAVCVARVGTGMSLRASGRTLAQRDQHRPLRKRIGWVAGVGETGTADSQKAFHLLDRFGDHTVWLAGPKLGFELNEGVIGPVEPPCQHGR